MSSTGPTYGVQQKRKGKVLKPVRAFIHIFRVLLRNCCLLSGGGVGADSNPLPPPALISWPAPLKRNDFDFANYSHRYCGDTNRQLYCRAAHLWIRATKAIHQVCLFWTKGIGKPRRISQSSRKMHRLYVCWLASLFLNIMSNQYELIITTGLER